MGERGLSTVADGIHAWLQPIGGWGWSNAGLVTGDGASLLVDTLFDLELTSEMLDALRPITQEQPITTLVNTHANGDHCYGNQLVTGADVIASRASAEEMEQVPPAVLAGFVEAAPQLGAAGSYVAQSFGQFHFAGIDPPPPSRVFDGELRVDAGGREVVLIEVGPAHTRGDVIVIVPDADVVFAGDVLFLGDTPVCWAGPVSRWIDVCDRLVAMSPKAIVPGHGPVTDASGVAEMRGYLSWLLEEAARRHAKGLTAEETARDLHRSRFADLNEPERIAINVDAAYREIDPDYTPADVITLFGQMADLAGVT